MKVAGITLQTLPALPCEHGQHHPLDITITLQTLPATPCKCCQHYPVNTASITL